MNLTRLRVLELGKGLALFVFEDADVGDAVDAVIRQDRVVVVVADEVVLAFLCDHLVRVDYVFFRIAVIAEPGMTLFVSAVIDVMERDLSLARNGFVQYLDREEQLLVVDLGIRERLDVFYMRSEMLTCKAFELLDEILAALVGHMVRKQQSVDQEP